jgi:hypothetical protein
MSINTNSQDLVRYRYPMNPRNPRILAPRIGSDIMTYIVPLTQREWYKPESYIICNQCAKIAMRKIFPIIFASTQKEHFKTEILQEIKSTLDLTPLLRTDADFIMKLITEKMDLLTQHLDRPTQHLDRSKTNFSDGFGKSKTQVT